MYFIAVNISNIHPERRKRSAKFLPVLHGKDKPQRSPEELLKKQNNTVLGGYMSGTMN